MNYELFNAIHSLSHHSNILDSFMIFVTEKAIYLYALMLLAIWLFGGSSYKKSVLQAGFTGILGLAANYLITLIYYEPRPFVAHHVDVLIHHAADASFPSDHTTGALAISIAFWLCHRRLGSLMIAFGLLTGFSRIWVGHHYPVDVLGSILVSVLVSLIVLRFSKYLTPIFNWIISLYDSILQQLKRKIFR
ncbi:undecaprenyl-diphosphatase [Bacillus sonorensis]|uniref:Undecaprenyl-diphosphatase BcrC n=2 Tax=Bacillus sonorensis TaxID=119858 RepID=M5P1Z7_9BACI|nr:MULTISPECIES: undecaprenyl-diphosphatase [Bacillus]TWK80645.1 Undecaprenyl-diphosphatase BcrC [Bacillus paralicheniformis]ASB87065.1 Undecaprenyl-diphosphate phosphatase [Bacillus sonorensis]EME73448.1 undecaprenyl-diphosphatase BcrC [Bacillus sonorensis L12]MBG9914426.1 UDP-diphosphatase [Bacillus sonorensis]MCF7616317.1 undecaprenyl-diphosphatase [Bacillus sonorensis]